MTAAAIIRLILEILGLIAIGAGLVGGIATMFKQIAKKTDEDKLITIDELTAFIQALIQLLQALVAAPIWLALVIIGIVLVLTGGVI
jgi:flagellar biosynthesis protein FlhB